VDTAINTKTNLMSCDSKISVFCDAYKSICTWMILTIVSFVYIFL